MTGSEDLLTRTTKMSDPAENLGLEVLLMEARDWKRAILCGYVHPETWEIQPERLRLKKNKTLQGGFNAGMTLQGLEELRDFWLSPADVNEWLPDSIEPRSGAEWRKFINGLDIGDPTASERIPVMKKPGESWVSQAGIERIQDQHDSTPATLTIYTQLCVLWGMQKRTAKFADHLKINSSKLSALCKVSVRLIPEALKLLQRMRLIRLRRAPHGYEIAVLNVSAPIKNRA